MQFSFEPFARSGKGERDRLCASPAGATFARTSIRAWTFHAREAWPDIDFRDDRDGSLFVATLRRKVVPGVLHGDLPGDLHGPGTGQVAEQALRVVENLDGVMTRHELQNVLSLGNRDHFRKAYLLPALEAGLVEMTRPDKPHSRSQHYRLTTTGKALRAQRRRG